MGSEEAAGRSQANGGSYFDQLRAFSRNAWLLVAAKFFAYITFGIFEVLFNLYLVRLGFREDYIGAFQSVNVMGLALFAVPAGIVGDRIGHRKAVLIGSAAMIVTWAVQSLLVDPTGLLVLSLLNGCAFSMAIVPAMPLWAEGGSTHLFAIGTTSSCLGEMLGNSLGGVLPGVFAAASLGLTADLVGPDRSALFVGIGFAIVGLVPFAYMRRRAPIQSSLSHNPPPGERFWTGREARTSIIMFSIIGSLGGVAGGMFVPFFNVYMSRELGASTDLVGYVYSIAAVGAVVGSLLGAQVASRWGKVVPVAVLRLLAVPFLLALLVAPHVGVGATAYFMRFAMMSMTWPIEWALFLGAISPRVRGAASGIRTGAWNGGWALASFVTGQILVRWGYNPVFVLAAVFSLANALIYLVYFGARARRVPAIRPVSD